ncbi:MAG: YtxH domain-containing protein [Chloroflexi bacterium]|nr:YtxH domain-containing protein [Chloroflexota bacterium]
MRKVLNFFCGLSFGALVGATIGVFLAPQPGDEVQASLRARLNAVLEDARRAAAERRAELEAQFAEAKRVAKA